MADEVDGEPTFERLVGRNAESEPSKQDDAEPVDDPHASGLVARTRSRAGQIGEQLAGRREDSRLVDAGFMVLARDRQFPTSLLAGALVSRIVIYMIPFLVLLIFVTGFYADLTNTSPEEAARQAGIAGLFAQSAGDSTTASTEWRFATVFITLSAVVWAADGVARNLRRVYALVWRVKAGRGWRWAFPLAVIGLSVLALASSRISDNWGSASTFLMVSQLVTEFLVMAGIWILASMMLPHHPDAGNWRNFVPGSLLMASAVMVAKAATVWYFAPRSVTYDERYGSVGIVLILLSWAYLISYATVASADANAASFRTRQNRSVGPDHSATS